MVKSPGAVVTKRFPSEHTNGPKEARVFCPAGLFSLV
jgi:hypothetical protein